MVEESAAEDVRALWQGQPCEGVQVQGQPCEGGGMPLDEIRRRVREVEQHARRRDRGFFACAAVIIPSWAAVMWWLPDLRVTAGISMAAACWIVSQAYIRSGARNVPTDLASAPSLDFYRTSLERERDLYRALPVWFVPPVVLSSTAIVLGFLTTTRFPHNTAIFAVLAWIVCGTCVALFAGIRNSRREARRYQALIEASTR